MQNGRREGWRNVRDFQCVCENIFSIVEHRFNIWLISEFSSWILTPRECVLCLWIESAKNCKMCVWEFPWDSWKRTGEYFKRWRWWGTQFSSFYFYSVFSFERKYKIRKIRASLTPFQIRTASPLHIFIPLNLSSRPQLY